MFTASEKVAEVAVANVPPGTYEVSIWTWEDTLVESFGVNMEGAPVDGLGRVSTVPGEWRILGPFTTDVNDGTLNIESTDTGAANFSAIKIDRVVRQAPVVSDRIAAVPYALLQQEFFMTLRPVPTAVIEEIVDTIFLPLVIGSSKRR